MKYPCLVNKRSCKTPISLQIDKEGLQTSGEPYPPVVVDNALCNYQDKAKTILTAEKKLVQITGTALFAGDIAPDVAAISGGFATIFEERRRIASGMKARNPDGTVNYTRLELV